MLNKSLTVFISIFILFLAGYFLASQSFAQESKFYQLVLAYSKGNFQAEDVIVLTGDISRINQGGDYRVELISFSNISLHKTNFDIPTSIHGEEFDYATGKITSRQTQLDEVEIVINIPYFPTGKQIEIYDPENKKILTISVAHFAEVTPTPISPTPEFKITKIEKGIEASWIITGGILLLIITAIGVFVYTRFKKPPQL